MSFCFNVGCVERQLYSIINTVLGVNRYKNDLKNKKAVPFTIDCAITMPWKQR